MSYLRDVKYIKLIGESNHFLPVSEDAARFTLAHTELILRGLLFQTAKVVKRFKRKMIRAEDIKISLSDMNLNFLLSGSTQRETENYVEGDEGVWELDPTEISIQTEMQNIVENKLTPHKKLELSFEWLSFNGVIYSSKLLAPPAGEEKQVVALPPPPRPIPEPSKNLFVVKEISPNVLSEEANDFFTTLTRILEEYFQMIDRDLIQFSFKKWQHTLSIIQTHAKLQVLLPFIFDFIMEHAVV